MSGTTQAPSPPVEPSARIPPAPGRPARPWWHGLGVFVIVATFLVFLDGAMDGRISWSVFAILAFAFLSGGFLILQFLASPGRDDRRPFLVGSVLLAASVVLMPVTLTVQSTATTTETILVPYAPVVEELNLTASVDAGTIVVDFDSGIAFLVRAEVVHVGGLFSSHTEGDLIATNATAGSALSFGISARGTPGFLFAGGHDIHLTIHENLSVALDLRSTTGSVSVDVRPDVAVRAIVATVTTGSVRVGSLDAVFADGARIEATSTTGSVRIEIDQAGGGAATVDVSGTSTTGGVTFLFDRGLDVAARVVSTVTTGSISFDSAKFQGTEALLFGPSQGAFDAARVRFDVRLTTTTGSIEVG